MKYPTIIIDDQEVYRKEAINAIENSKLADVLELYEAEDGLEGYNLIKDKSNFRFIITDINMPNLDGISMLEKINNDCPDLLKKAMVFVQTTVIDPDLKRKGKEVGVTAWLMKPVKWDIITIKIEKQIFNMEESEASS
jgi:two-component system, chemotaxis family, chemotaxis protein CheY